MKKIVLLLVMLFSVTSLFADDFSDASVEFCRGHYAEAKALLERCLKQTEYKSIYSDIKIHIETCNTRIAEQRANTVQAAKKRAEKLRQNEKNKYYYISVIAPENISNHTKAMASEVLNKAGVSECQKLEDAWMVVTVSVSIYQHETIHGFYAAEGEGFVSVGYADKTKSSGFRTVEALSQTPVGQADAERLVRNKLNYRLSHKLDNLINGRPETEKVPEQIIALKLITPNIKGITASHLCNVMNSYISNKEGVKLTSILDMKLNQARDEDAATLSIYGERDGRAPVRELKGYNQIIYIEITESNSYLIFNASLQDTKGLVITSATLDGSTFGITTTNFNTTNQELVAKMLVARLGLGGYKMGDVAYIDNRGREVRFASVDGMHGTLFIDPAKYNLYPACRVWNGVSPRQYTLASVIGVDSKEGWRLPSVRELEGLNENKQFRLTSVYWTSEQVGKKSYKVVDFRQGPPKEGVYKERQCANIVAIREF